MKATKREQLVAVMKDFPRRTSKEYGHLTGRPHPSIRRDLALLEEIGVVKRVRKKDGRMETYWDGTWEAAK